jgi:hypothetical protein
MIEASAALAAMNEIPYSLIDVCGHTAMVAMNADTTLEGADSTIERLQAELHSAQRSAAAANKRAALNLRRAELAEAEIARLKAQPEQAQARLARLEAHRLCPTALLCRKAFIACSGAPAAARGLAPSSSASSSASSASSVSSSASSIDLERDERRSDPNPPSCIVHGREGDFTVLDHGNHLGKAARAQSTGPSASPSTAARSTRARWRSRRCAPSTTESSETMRTR